MHTFSSIALWPVLRLVMCWLEKLTMTNLCHSFSCEGFSAENGGNDHLDPVYIVIVLLYQQGIRILSVGKYC